MTKDEALKLALEALEVATTPFARDRQEVLRAQAALRQALAEQPAQREPVAYMSRSKENFVSADDVGNSVPNWTDYYPTPLYTTPPPCPTCEALARTVMMDQTAHDTPPAQQEPVAYASSVEWRKNQLMSKAQFDSCLPKNRVDFDVPLYTSPPAQRTWVGLTHEEVEEVWEKVESSDFLDCVHPLARAIEAKLKEKNT